MLASVLAIALMATSNPAPAVQSAPNAAVSRADQETGRLAREWIALVDAGQWEKSWRRAGTTFREAITAEGWAAQVEPVRQPLGKVVSRTLAQIEAHGELPGVPSGNYRIVQFSTDFAQAPGAVETVVMAEETGSWVVVGYFIK